MTISPGESRRLRRANALVGIVHAAQAAAILLLAADVSLPVTASFLEGPPGGDARGSTLLFEMPIAVAVAIFLALAAVDHLAVAAPRLHRWYEHELAHGINRARWWEYSISASLMVVLIAMLTGISEATALIAIFGVNAAMILFGLLMEARNPPGEPVDWQPFIFGCIAGAFPWIAIALTIAVAEGESGTVPGFVVAIFISLFALFMSFAMNMWLQYRRRGRWRSYLFGERVYIALSLVAKSALAWQVYGGALAGS